MIEKHTNNIKLMTWHVKVMSIKKYSKDIKRHLCININELMYQYYCQFTENN